MIPELLQRLTHEWRPDLEAGGLTFEPPLYALKVGSVSVEEHLRTFLIFDRAGELPLMSVKVGRAEADRARLTHEFATLQCLATLAPIRPTLPLPLALREIGESSLALVERGMPGTPLSTLLRNQQHLSAEEVRADLRLVQGWLQRFHAATTSSCRPLDGRALVEERLARLDEASRAALPEPFVARLRAEGDHYAARSLPRVGRHGDLWAGNLLLGEGTLAVIDWDGYEADTLPFHDLFHFLVTYAQTYPWHGWRWTKKLEGFERGFLSEGWFSALLRQYVRDFLEALSVPPEAAHFLFSIYLMTMAAPDHPAANSFKVRWSGLLPFYARRQHDSIFLR